MIVTIACTVDDRHLEFGGHAGLVARLPDSGEALQLTGATLEDTTIRRVSAPHRPVCRMENENETEKLRGTDVGGDVPGERGIR
jgi:hypothetical protein